MFSCMLVIVMVLTHYGVILYSRVEVPIANMTLFLNRTHRMENQIKQQNTLRLKKQTTIREMSMNNRSSKGFMGVIRTEVDSMK